MGGTGPATSETRWGRAPMHCADDGCVRWTAAAESAPVGLMHGRRQRATGPHCSLRCSVDVHARLPNCRHDPSV